VLSQDDNRSCYLTINFYGNDAKGERIRRGIPIVDENQRLKGIVTNRDLRFEKVNSRPNVEVMTSKSFNHRC
jgi:CBS domain-containing protein